MTDDELRTAGQRFIDRSRAFIRDGTVPPGSVFSPDEKAEALAYWDYIDPLRMGIYLKVAGKDGAFTLDPVHIRQVCVNPSAFIERRENSARIGAFTKAALDETGLVTVDGEPANCVTPASFDTLADGTPLDAFRAPEEL